MASPTIDLRSGQGRFFIAHDLMEDEEFIIEFSLDAPSSPDCRFGALIVDGEEARLTEGNPTYMAVIPGYYRVTPEDDVEEATVDVSDPMPVTLHRVI